MKPREWTEVQKRDGQIMQSAFALCPTAMSHPDRMRWIADYFLNQLKNHCHDHPKT